MKDVMDIIKERRSSRVPYAPGKEITREQLVQILEAARWAPTAHNMQNYELVVVTDKAKLSEISAIQFPENEAFIRENYLQLSFSEEELKQKKAGVLGTMFPKSWLHPVFMPGRTDDDEKDHIDADRHNNMMPCPVLVVMLYDPARRAPASEGDFFGIMSLGCVLENMLLMAENLGIATHIVSSLSRFHAEQQMRTILEIPPHLNIAISFRLGYPDVPGEYLRVRREIPDFTHWDGYR